MNVDALLDRLTSRQIAEWMAYYTIEPFGEQRADLRAAIVASTVANANRDPAKRREPFSPTDFMPQFEPRQWLELVERERVSHAFVVPTMMKHLLDQPDFRERDLSSLEVLSYGGAPMPFPVIRRAIEMFPKTVGFVNAFGQTETANDKDGRRVSVAFGLSPDPLHGSSSARMIGFLRLGK